MNLTLDDLEIGKYKIYQDKDAFCFGIDSVLLANFALRESGLLEKDSSAPSHIEVCDLCSGNIPIPLIMYAKSKKDLYIKAFEIEKDSCDLAKKSLDYNANDNDGPKDKKILDDIDIINIDLNDVLDNKEKYKKYFDTFDILTCNPPYIKVGAGLQNDVDKKTKARHEVSIDFDKICKIAYLFLKSKKRFFIVHRTNRLSEIIYILKNNNLEPKSIQCVYPKMDEKSNLFLLEARKDAGMESSVLPPIVVYDEDGSYTKEVLNIYGK